MCRNRKRWVAVLLVSLLAGRFAAAQFAETFDGPSLDGWSFFTGDGAATMDFQLHDGYASIVVDARQDSRNIWWALIKRDVSSALDLRRLAQPGYELRIAARLRVSHAPRRVNLHLNTQKTVDFHTHLMEFDIPDTLRWHTISMTTHGFEAGPGDTVNGQLALMDWGLGTYRVDLDEFRVDVVEAARAAPDVGEPIPYHPPVADPDTFSHHVAVAHDATVDLQYPDVNFNGWYAAGSEGKAAVLAVGAAQLVILRWDLARYAGKQAAGSGLLELTTHAVQRTEVEQEEFGKIRVAEILAGDPKWEDDAVTLHSLTRGQPLDEVFNSQMIIDVDATEVPGGSTRVTVPRPVLQRLLDGRTLGLVLRPLGAIHAAFYASEQEEGSRSPVLHFNVETP